jgi:hypothetical protein
MHRLGGAIIQPGSSGIFDLNIFITRLLRWALLGITGHYWALLGITGHGKQLAGIAFKLTIFKLVLEIFNGRRYLYDCGGIDFQRMSRLCHSYLYANCLYCSSPHLPFIFHQLYL